SRRYSHKYANRTENGPARPISRVSVKFAVALNSEARSPNRNHDFKTSPNCFQRVDVTDMDVAERAWARSDPVSHSGAGQAATLSPGGPATENGERMVLNLFFEERDDRWFPGDRHLRPLLRRMLLGKSWISGQRRVFLNLCAGLDGLGIRYRINDYRYVQKHPEELACILGRPFVLERIAWKNPILLGVASYNHPADAPH